MSETIQRKPMFSRKPLKNAGSAMLAVVWEALHLQLHRDDVALKKPDSRLWALRDFLEEAVRSVQQCPVDTLTDDEFALLNAVDLNLSLCIDAFRETAHDDASDQHGVRVPAAAQLHLSHFFHHHLGPLEILGHKLFVLGNDRSTEGANWSEKQQLIIQTIERHPRRLRSAEAIAEFADVTANSPFRQQVADLRRFGVIEKDSDGYFQVRRRFRRSTRSRAPSPTARKS